ncbi:hypothetical protein D046_0698A, partial [Vibrio parahaemolyticus V-223/04]
MIRLFDAFTF